MPADLSVAFLPPGSDPNVPSPRIGFTLVADTAFDPNVTLPPDVTQPTVVTIAGTAGRAYADDVNAMPLQATDVELPHRGGTLFVSATIGPDVDLRPVLDQILATLTLEP